jgi:4-amino-4-deoxy-L-arabinose transferase-like glycosyltransferase
MTVLVAALALVGAVVRVVVAHQSLFADELSTYWISARHGIGGVLSLMYGTGAIKHAEITPPLSFLLSWLTTRPGDSPELLRLPELIGGIATIPVVYLLGLRTVGRRAAVVAAALVTFSPFMIYYSAEARAYGVMMLAVVVSTLAMLRALDTGGRRWWVVYAVAACAAFYSHYTSIFVLAAQALWAFWVRPDARRPLVVSSLAAGAGVIPWIPGLIRDMQSPTLTILSALSPFNPGEVRLDLEHWSIGYPYSKAGGLTGLPGTPALIMLAVAVVLVLSGLILARRSASTSSGGAVRLLALRDQRVRLMVVLLLATPVGEAVVSAAGNHQFSVRNLAASWPFLALVGGLILTAQRTLIAILASGLAVVALALGASKMFSGRFTRPAYDSAAAYVSGRAQPGDVVIDGTGFLSPGPGTGLDAALHRQLPIFRAYAPAERGHPFGVRDRIVPLPQAIDQALRAVHGHRLFLVLLGAGRPPAVGEGYRLQALRLYSGLGGVEVGLYTRSASSP